MAVTSTAVRNLLLLCGALSYRIPEYMAPELVRSPNAGAMLRYAGGNSAAGSNQSSVEGGGSPASSSGPPPPAMMKRYDARKVDAWALGVLFYVLVCAQYPFSVSYCPQS